MSNSLWCQACREATSGDCGQHGPAHSGGITMYPPTQVGWKCPVCGRGNAPWNPTCQCSDVRSGS